LFSPSLGVVNAVLKSVFGVSSALLGDPKLSLFLVILVQLWISTGWAMVIYIAGLQSIPQELIDAVRVDGASPWQIFRYLTLPLLQPAVTINILISLIGSLKIADTIFILTNYDSSTKNLPVYIFQGVLGGGNQGTVATFSLVHFLIVSLVVVVAQYFLRRRERYLE
jgi:raffinose/stachyose/melibiose transport system permease protein